MHWTHVGEQGKKAQINRSVDLRCWVPGAPAQEQIQTISFFKGAFIEKGISTLLESCEWLVHWKFWNTSGNESRVTHKVLNNPKLAKSAFTVKMHKVHNIEN